VTTQNLQEKRFAYAQDLKNAVDHIIAELSENPDIERVVLFGSYANDRRDLLTDLDILVIMESSLDYISRTAELYKQLHPGVDFDLLVYTPQEFEQMRNRSFLKHALKQSKVLYEKREPGRGIALVKPGSRRPEMG
jgi:predicted nucleotidyltransferase